MLIVLAVVSALIAVWSAWLVRARAVPGWVRLVAPLVVISTITTAAVTFWLMHSAFDNASTSDSGNKASELAHDISTAMNAIAVGCAIAVLGAAILGWFTLRAKRRD